MIDLQTPAENRYQLAEVQFKKVSDYRIEGFSKQFAPMSGAAFQTIISFTL